MDRRAEQFLETETELCQFFPYLQNQKCGDPQRRDLFTIARFTS